MSETQMLPAVGPSTTDSPSESAPDGSQFDAIVQAAFGDTARSSGSLESNASSSLGADASGSSASSSSTSTSHSVPSLTTSSSTTASAASSKTPSPSPSILRSNSAPPSAFPTVSSPPSPNVTFAPLPQTEPRKRNSSHPLGVAARSRLLRHRRMLRERGLNPDDYQYHYQHEHQYTYGVEGGTGFPTDADPHPYGEGDAAVEFPEMPGGEGGEERVRVRRARTASDVRGEEEDPFVALGKLVKGAGKTLWKSLSMRDMRAKERDAAKAKDKDGARGDGQARTSEGEGRCGDQSQSRSVGEEAVPRRCTVETVHLFEDDGATPPTASGEGGVWEEEVTEDSWKKLLSNPPPVPDTANADNSQDARSSTSVEPTDDAPVLTTIVMAQPSTTKVR
ncbi:hypothetical protein LXA43DRAFT_1082532 [Ganoderma leucocontextum]|nr:hypothetical protein LXA43DRAFT_1082532 [Ganoderma leucocontextum]